MHEVDDCDSCDFPLPVFEVVFNGLRLTVVWCAVQYSFVNSKSTEGACEPYVRVDYTTQYIR